MRVTTVRFGAPRSQAAGCLIRLQLPLNPATRAGGGLRPPPPGERNEKVRDVTQGGKRVLVIAARIPAREKARRVSRSAVPCCTALWAALGNAVPPIPPWIFGNGTRSAGAWALGVSRRFPQGGVRRTARDRGDAAGPQPWPLAAARGWAGAVQGALRRPIPRWGAVLARRAAGPRAGHKPALDVAPGVARWLKQLLGLPGPTRGRVSSGRGLSWVSRAHLPAEPWAVGPLGPPGLQPLALGLTRRIRPRGTLAPRQPGGRR